MKIRNVTARRIWDSRGRPTIEIEVTNEDGTAGLGIAPAGASRGTREAVERRDGGSRFGGLDVQQALAGIRDEIAPALAGRDVGDQAAIDAMLVDLDGTQNRSRLGGNALVATSLAVLHAAAAHARLPLWRYLSQGKPVRLPLPQIQIFGGGAHAGRRVDVQDFMVIATGASSFSEALEMTAEVYRCAGEWIAGRGLLSGVADEGGWWPSFSRNEDALDALVEAISKAGYTPGREVSIALDIAASEFGSGGRYRLALEQQDLDSDGWSERLVRWIERYPIVSIEDPLAEDDEAGLAKFTRAVGDLVQVVGDDYLVTNAARVRQAAAAGACNCVLVKPNQAGTVSESRAAMEAARAAGYATIVSARSGETEDVAILHLATGCDAGQLKVGSFARSERMAKWNEGVRLETRPGAPDGFWGRAALRAGGNR